MQYRATRSTPPETARQSRHWLLLIGGLANLCFAAFHLTFPWLFGWGTDLASLSATNRAILYTAHVEMILLLTAFGIISIACRHALVTTRLGRVVARTIALFWLARAIAEIIFFGIGLDGSWWRLVLFVLIAETYVAEELAGGMVGGRAR